MHNSFKGGELAPDVHGNTESELYNSSLEEINNMIVRSQGGVVRRNGSELIRKSENIYKIRDSGTSLGDVAFTGAFRIFPFVSSQDESYAVIIKADGADSLISIIRLETLTQCFYEDGFRSSSTYEDILYDSLWPSTIDMNEMQYAQNGDFLFITHPSAAPFVLRRTGTVAFDRYLFYYNEARFLEGYGQYGFPYLPLNTNTNHTMSLTGLSGTTLNSNIDYFTSDHVGAMFKLTDGSGDTQEFRVTGYTDEKTLTGSCGNADVASAALSATSLWEESAWSDERGWPRTVTFYEQRIYYGGSESYPDTVWASQLGDIFELDALDLAQSTGYGTVTAADPFSFSTASTEANRINFLSSGRTLVIGTQGREYIAQGTSGVLSALDVSVSAETSYGSPYRQPVRSDNAMLFLSRNSKSLREFLFSRDEGSYKADDLSRFANHFLRKGFDERATIVGRGITALAMQESGSSGSVVWCIDKNGMLFALTRDPYVNTRGWHYHRLGGNLGGELPFIHSIASIPSADGTEDELWLAVERTIDGSDVTYIERIRSAYSLTDVTNSSDEISDKLVYCDSAKLKYNATAFTTVDGLSHLEGETVVCVADGDYKGEFEVSFGEIELSEEVNDAVVGLAFESSIKTLPHNVGSALQTSQIALKRFDRIGIRFNRTIGAVFSSEDGDEYTINFRDPDLASSSPTPLFTGDKIEDISDDYDRSGRVVIKQTLPYPQEIVSIVLRGILYD